MTFNDLKKKLKADVWKHVRICSADGQPRSPYNQRKAVNGAYVGAMPIDWGMLDKIAQTMERGIVECKMSYNGGRATVFEFVNLVEPMGDNGRTMDPRLLEMTEKLARAEEREIHREEQFEKLTMMLTQAETVLKKFMPLDNPEDLEMELQDDSEDDLSPYAPIIALAEPIVAALPTLADEYFQKRREERDIERLKMLKEVDPEEYRRQVVKLFEDEGPASEGEDF